MAFLENSNGFFGTVELLLWPARNVFLHVYMAFLENSNGFFGTVDLLLWPARKAFCIHIFLHAPNFLRSFFERTWRDFVGTPRAGLGMSFLTMPKPKTKPMYFSARNHVGLEVPDRHVAWKLTFRQEHARCVARIHFFLARFPSSSERIHCAPSS